MPPVLARRYRPQTFDAVVGQEAIVQTLRRAVSGGRVAQGYIFSGHRGIGKTTVARILAKALNCQAGAAPAAEPCGACDSCREIAAGTSVDVLELDAASNRGIDEVRALRERARYRPARDRFKVFILDEAHQLTGDAFNALLKTLEEPPEWAVFVLATTEPEALPATIRSRCQHFAFRPVRFAQLAQQLQTIAKAEQIAVEPEAVELMAEAGEGSVRDALSLFDQAISYADQGPLQADTVRMLLGRASTGQIAAVLEQVAQDSARGVLVAAAEMLEAGLAPAQLAWQLTQAVRNALVVQTAPELLEGTESARAAAGAAAQAFREEELTRFLQILLRCSGQLRFGQQERLHLELALVSLIHARRLSPVEDVLAALGGAAPAAPARRPGGEKMAAAPPTAPVGAAAGQPAAPAAAPAATPVATVVATAGATVVATAGAAVVATAGAAGAAAGAVRPAAPAAAAAAAGTAQAGVEPAHAVLQQLEAQGKTALLSILDKAVWQFDRHCLQLTFSGEHAALGALANQEAARKATIAACVAACGFSPELTVVSRPEEAAPELDKTPPPPGSPEERAEQHPVLRQLREAVPMHVLKTRHWPPT